MPTIPWARLADAEPDAEVVVMASRLEVRSLRHVPGFLRASLVLLRQARAADGAVGVALRAEPFKRTFWTLSAWRDKKALYAYSAAEPHKAVMRRKRAVMRDSTFVFWEAKAGDLPIDWPEAERRIAEN
ncbi:DUF3291 domain-containing protein [Actinomadura chibensis]|uniref:DUF3291 domain-containing protein n=1 Tax=Actinomadura chibensis TaxID=392828 RepID=A0A5D0NCW2_9ACTN|nr:DUF3291 domain-containing protein [Actinomadura chibensis]TYB42248.1 DUF3291 domain-containing protein [Actinomadura chibensis]